MLLAPGSAPMLFAAVTQGRRGVRSNRPVHEAAPLSLDGLTHTVVARSRAIPPRIPLSVPRVFMKDVLLPSYAGFAAERARPGINWVSLSILDLYFPSWPLFLAAFRSSLAFPRPPSVPRPGLIGSTKSNTTATG